MVKNKKPTKNILNKEQFIEFIKDKICYHHQSGWIQVWTGDDLTRYIPSNNFFLKKDIVLKRYGYDGYSEECLGHYTSEGIFYQDLNFWKVTISDKNGKYYIQEFNGGSFFSSQP